MADTENPVETVHNLAHAVCDGIWALPERMQHHKATITYDHPDVYVTFDSVPAGTSRQYRFDIEADKTKLHFDGERATACRYIDQLGHRCINPAGPTAGMCDDCLGDVLSDIAHRFNPIAG